MDARNGCLRLINGRRFGNAEKNKLEIKTLLDEAAKFAEAESTCDEPSLYGVTDGKAGG